MPHLIWKCDSTQHLRYEANLAMQEHEIDTTRVHSKLVEMVTEEVDLAYFGDRSALFASDGGHRFPFSSCGSAAGGGHRYQRLTFGQQCFGEDVSAYGAEARALTMLIEAASATLVDKALPCTCLLYTSPSPRDATLSRMPSSA